MGHTTVAITPAGPELVANASTTSRIRPSHRKRAVATRSEFKITAPTPIFADASSVVASGRGARAGRFLCCGQTPAETSRCLRVKRIVRHCLEPNGRGSYMPTPLIYNGVLYVLANNGLFDA